MKIRLLTLLVFVLAMIGSVESQDLKPGRGQAPAAQSKIAPWVIEKTAGGAVAEFLVVLADQADLSSASALRTKEEKGRFVYETLFNKARTTQGPILAWLKERKVEHRAYYIVNMIWVKADINVAMELAARADVARVEGNPQIRNVPEQMVEETPATPDEINAIELGINYTRAPQVWALGFTGQGVVVAGADTGYRWTHSALKGKYRGWDGATANHDFNWHDSIHSGGGSCGANSPAPCDDQGHGTHTMGTVVGDDGGANQVGMAPGARWIGCRNMNQGAGTPATYIECFEFFLAPYPVAGTPAQGDPSKAPHVTNNSWGCPPSEGCSANTLQAAVEAQRAAGIMTVVSAGNSGSSCSTVSDPPAIYDASYSVGALNNGTDTIAGFSSRGPVVIDGSLRMKPDIAAPGTSVRSSTRTSDTSYGSLSGTSMAGPHVAGAVALLLSAIPSLRGQVSQTETVLNSSAVHINSATCDAAGGSPNNVFGHGRLDIKAAVDSQQLGTISPTGQFFPQTGGEGMINVAAAAGINWTAVSNAPWISLTGATGGTGNGEVSYLVRDNMTGAPRQGTITVAGKTFTVIQDGPSSGDCKFGLNPKFNSFASAGGAGSTNVQVEPNCPWSAVSNNAWITITSSCCGIGPGTITYSVTANPGPSSRNGTISVGGQVFSVKQKAP
ncbi:MAG TPA: S8 family serine peptidase [Blastocatellia bacterium]|nr:S8 family serine peptidase [Blastocatellia bacterium]